MNDKNEVHSEDIIALARGPLVQARRFNAYNVNGFKFRTLEREQGMKTQNSGVFGTFGTNSYASTSDDCPAFGGVPYYGKLVDIIELNYYSRFKITMFKCKWANTTTSAGLRKDALGFDVVNFSRLIHTGEYEDDEPYIKASDARMVYYVEDEVDKNWCVPIHLKPRDLFEMGEDEEDDVLDSVPYPEHDLGLLFPDDANNIPLARDNDDDEPILLDDLENRDDNIDGDMMA